MAKQKESKHKIHFFQNESTKDIYEILLYFCYLELNKCTTD